MAFALTWMPSVLEEAGLRVAECKGWQSRGRSQMGKVLGVMVHHTVGPKTGNMPSLDTLLKGHPTLAGPLANLGLGRDGTWYVVAAGRANHAGAGEWRKQSDGNSNFIGIEAENTGLKDDMPWPEAQMLALIHGVAALLRHSGRTTEWCVGHKEYARPPGRKIDPLFDMQQLRLQVSDVLTGIAPPITPIPAVEATPASADKPPRPTLERGDGGAHVMALQKALGIDPADGLFGANTEAAVRVFQGRLGLKPDGIVGPKSWAGLDTL